MLNVMKSKSASISKFDTTIIISKLRPEMERTRVSTDSNHVDFNNLLQLNHHNVTFIPAPAPQSSVPLYVLFFCFS